MSDIVELAPCPFCGEAAEMQAYVDGHTPANTSWKAQCSKCHAGAPGGTWQDSDIEIAADCWNERVTTSDTISALTAERDALRQQLAESESERHEQARLLGISAELELSALAKANTAERERNLLAASIGEASQKAGVYNGEVGLTGPYLLMLTGDMADCILSLRQQLDQRA